MGRSEGSWMMNHDVELLGISFVQGSMGMYSGVLVRIYKWYSV